MAVLSCNGDYGDYVFFLDCVAELPNGPHTVLLHTCPQSKPTKIKTQEDLDRFAAMAIPLAKVQPYVSECRIAEPSDDIHWVSGDFRGTWPWCPKVSLLGAKGHHMSATLRVPIPKGEAPWLHVTPSPESSGRIIVNRTGRYRNDYFPWREIVNFYGDRLLFVGVPHEYRDFCGQFGAIEYRKTSDLLEMAQLIAGSQLVIANQSCVNALAEGLKHPLIQETSLHIPDCIFRRPNAQHVYDGSCSLTNFDTGEIWNLPSKFEATYEVNETVVPPGQWQFPEQPPMSVLKLLVEKVWNERGRPDRSLVMAEIVEHNVKRLPEWFADPNARLIFQTFREAFKNASVE